MSVLFQCLSLINVVCIVFIFCVNCLSSVVCCFGWFWCVLKLLSVRCSIVILFCVLGLDVLYVVSICIVVLIDVLNVLVGKVVLNLCILLCGCSWLVVFMMLFLMLMMCVSVGFCLCSDDGLVSWVVWMNCVGLMSVIVCVLFDSGFILVLLSMMLFVVKLGGIGVCVKVCVSQFLCRY